MTMKVVKVDSRHFSKIKIPQNFVDNPPRPEKLIYKMLVFSRESELGDIIVDDKMNLMDGYCSYLIAQQVGADFVKIKMIKRCK